MTMQRMYARVQEIYAIRMAEFFGSLNFSTAFLTMHWQ
jgi:hypothetical protein